MTKTEFFSFINDLKFELNYNNWQLPVSDRNGLPFETFMIDFFEDKRFTLNLSRLSTGGVRTGKNFGVFDIKTFGDTGDLQLPIFLSFLNSEFINVTGSPNSKITEYIRNNKIENLLK